MRLLAFLFLASFSISLQAQTNTPPLTPIRTAKLKAVIFKQTVVENSDGTFGSKLEEVCSGINDVPVFDVRNNTGMFTYNHALECQTTFNGKAEPVRLYGVLAIHEGQLFSDEKSSTFKEASVSLRVGTFNTSNWQSLAAEFVAKSRDVNAKSIMGEVKPTNVTNCSQKPDGSYSCTASLYELFYASIEFRD